MHGCVEKPVLSLSKEEFAKSMALRVFSALFCKPVCDKGNGLTAIQNEKELQIDASPVEPESTDDEVDSRLNKVKGIEENHLWLCDPSVPLSNIPVCSEITSVAFGSGSSGGVRKGVVGSARVGESYCCAVRDEMANPRPAVKLHMDRENKKANTTTSTTTKSTDKIVCDPGDQFFPASGKATTVAFNSESAKEGIDTVLEVERGQQKTSEVTETELKNVPNLGEEIKLSRRDLKTILSQKRESEPQRKAEKTRDKQETAETEEIVLSRGQSKTTETVETVLMKQYHHHVMEGVLKTVPDEREEIACSVEVSKTDPRQREEIVRSKRAAKTDPRQREEIVRSKRAAKTDPRQREEIVRSKRAAKTVPKMKILRERVERDGKPQGGDNVDDETDDMSFKICELAEPQLEVTSTLNELCVADQVLGAPNQRQGGGCVLVTVKLNANELREPGDGVLLLMLKDPNVIKPLHSPPNTTEEVETVLVNGRDEMGSLRRKFDPGGDCHKDPESRRCMARGWYSRECHRESKRRGARTLFDPGGARAGRSCGPCHTHHP